MKGQLSCPVLEPRWRGDPVIYGNQKDTDRSVGKQWWASQASCLEMLLKPILDQMQTLQAELWMSTSRESVALTLKAHEHYFTA